MADSFFSIIPDERWKIIAQDPGQWRIGIYRPEYAAESEIKELERHTCPELFICAGGPMGLVVRSESGEDVKTLAPGEAAFITEHHNGFCASPDGYFIVAERTSFSTEFIDRATGAFLRREEA